MVRPRHKTYHTCPTAALLQEMRLIHGDTLREVEKIPLPNEKDETAFDAMPAAGSRSPSMFFRKLHSDEIILLFLIFILIAEGIDDDFLLIVLIYLLVSEIFEEYFRLQNKSV